MKNQRLWALMALLAINTPQVLAAPAIEVLGQDYAFPHRIEGMPAKLSDSDGLQIKTFVTNDGVQLAYWEAGHGTRWSCGGWGNTSA